MTTIKLKNGSGAPTSGDLVTAEPALDLTNKRLYTEDSGGTVIEVGTNPTSIITGAITGSGDMAINTNTLFVDVSANAVGIGTSSPDYALHVSGGATNIAAVFESTDADTWISLIDSNTTNNSTVMLGVDTDDMVFRAGGAEYMRLDNTGNVGIGTTSPVSPLQVNVGTNLNLGINEDSSTVRLSAYNDAASASVPMTINSSSTRFDIGGSEAMRIDSNKNVGIGTTSPQAYLHVYGTNAEILRLQGNDEFTFLSFRGTVGTEQTLGYVGFANDTGTAADLNLNNSQSGAISFSANGAERMRIDSSGNVGVGNSSPIYKLDLNGDMRFTSGSAMFWGDANVYEGRTVNDRYWVTGGTERMRIDSSGNLLVGTTDSTIFDHTTGEGVVIGPNAIQISRSSDQMLLLNRMTTNGLVAGFYAAGVGVGSISVTGSATTYNTSSDQRLKENIVDAPSASDDIDAIQVRSFDWKADGSHQKYGMVAQELQSVAPEAVSEGATEEDMMGVDYSKLVPMLVKEIQSLRARVAQLETN